MKLRHLTFLAFLSVAQLLPAQKTADTTGREQIEILHADRLILDEKYPGLKLLTGNVHLKHKESVLTSDKALVDLQANFAEAIDNVRLIHADSLTVTAGILRYDGNREFAVALDQVHMQDPAMNLDTDTLFYDIRNQLAYYTGGGIIRDSANTLQSRSGKYIVKENSYEFTGNVHLDNPEYRIESVRLDYNTADKTARFFGPTLITSSDGGRIYAEKGFYDTRNDIAWFVHNIFMESGASALQADSVYMDKTRAFYSASGNVRMRDSVNRSLILAGYAEQWRERDSVFLSDSPVIVNYEPGNDTLYIRADKMYVRQTRGKREFFASPGVMFLQGNFSGRADSLYRSEEKKRIELWKNPVIWTEDAQITGKKIIILYDSTGTRPDSLIIPGDVFIIQRDSAGFNQIKGNILKGKFIEGKLRHIEITGNTEMIYHVRDEKNQPVGIDKSICSKLELYLSPEGKTEKVVLREQPQGTTYPPDRFPRELSKLPGFLLMDDLKITSPAELLQSRNPVFRRPRMPNMNRPPLPKKFKISKKLLRGI